MRYDELMALAEKKMAEQNIVDPMTRYGAESGYTRVVNTEYFKTLAFKIRTIDSQPAETGCEIWGRKLASPILAGAMSAPRFPNMDDAMTAWAQGCLAAGSMMGMGIGSQDKLKEVIETGAPTYRISKPFKDRQKIIDEFREAERLGAVAVGTDTDFVQGAKPGHKSLMAGEVAPFSRQELTELRQTTSLPFIIKGVLHEDDAIKAMEIGAQAIVVSNHRAMVLDHCVHALEVLPQIRRTVGSSLTILADGGFMTGGDVLKALALGADGVLVGQAIYLGYIAAGAEGVKDMLNEMTSQLHRAMTLTGCPSIASIDESILFKRGYIL